MAGYQTWQKSHKTTEVKRPVNVDVNMLSANAYSRNSQAKRNINANIQNKLIYYIYTTF